MVVVGLNFIHNHIKHQCAIIAKMILLHPCGWVESYVIARLEYFQFLNMSDKIDYSSLTSTLDVLLHFISGLHQRSVCYYFQVILWVG